MPRSTRSGRAGDFLLDRREHHINRADTSPQGVTLYLIGCSESVPNRAIKRGARMAALACQDNTEMYQR